MIFGMSKGRRMSGKESVCVTPAAYNSLSGSGQNKQNKPCKGCLRMVYRSGCFKSVYTCPWAHMASATLMKPPMLAPFT